VLALRDEGRGLEWGCLDCVSLDWDLVALFWVRKWYDVWGKGWDGYSFSIAIEKASCSLLYVAHHYSSAESLVSTLDLLFSTTFSSLRFIVPIRAFNISLPCVRLTVSSMRGLLSFYWAPLLGDRCVEVGKYVNLVRCISYAVWVGWWLCVKEAQWVVDNLECCRGGLCDSNEMSVHALQPG
jgi:hypothetical protein